MFGLMRHLLIALCLDLFIPVKQLQKDPRMAEGVMVMEFQKDRVKTMETQAIYNLTIDRNRLVTSTTLCARFQMYILHGWATYFHLEDTKGEIMKLSGELWVEKVRPVFSRHWNFQLLKENFRMFWWYHLCFTYNDDEHMIRTYVDGKLNNDQRYDVGRPIKGDRVILGQGYEPERSFSGLLTQVNVWDRALTSEEIQRMATCQDDPQGNYVAWENGWTLYNVTSFDMPLGEFCQEARATEYFVFPDQTYPIARYLCRALGTELPRPKRMEDCIPITNYANKFLPDNKSCKFEYWVSLSDTQEEGVWRYQDGEIYDGLDLWRDQEPNGLHYENCVVIANDGFSDVDCEVNRKCVVCTFTSQQRFSLLGTCEFEERNIYFLVYQESSTDIYFMGYGSYYIRKEGDQWLWIDDVNNMTVARMEKHDFNYPIGRRWWSLEREVCGQEPGSMRLLLLTSCEGDKYTCDDGTCIEHSQRCDIKYDCRDNSDEYDCQLIDRPDDYQPHLPPRSSQGDNSSLSVIISIKVQSISVQTVDMTMAVAYEVMLTWEDNRLEYLNIKEDSALNSLPYEEMLRYWSPEVAFLNVNGNHHTYVDKEATMMINRKGTTKSRDPAAPAEVDVYPGKVNSLSIKRKYSTLYNCDFHLQLYPFDDQECAMQLMITSASKAFLVFDQSDSSAVNIGDNTLTEYNVGELQLKHIKTGTYSEAHVMIPLKRLYGYAVLNIYVPTVVLLVVSYITLYIRTNMFDVRMMAALTVQLVIATLFSQVSSTLPKTSYFKMVDVWLMFCIGITFIVIVFHAIIDNVVHPSDEDGSKSSSSTAISPSLAWKEGGLPVSSDFSARRLQKERYVRASKVIALTVFIAFNFFYWGYLIV